MNLFIKVPGREWPAHDPDIKKLLGMAPTDKIPVEGIDPVYIQGIKVWAQSLEYARRETPGQRFRLRVMAECPICKREVAAGRLWQHSRIHDPASESVKLVANVARVCVDGEINL